MDSLISDLEKFKIETVITTIDLRSGISEDWLGKNFDRNTYNEFKKLNIDPFGENGEFHTFVVNSGLFERKLQYKLNGKKGQYISISAY